MGYEFSNQETYDLIPEGDYEVVLETAEIKKTKDETKRYINCMFKIREDVEQGSKGRVVFDTIWSDRENPNQFDKRKLHKILLTQGPNGKYSFADDDEIVQHINGLTMIVHVNKNGADQYHQEDYNEVKYCSYKPSKAQPKTIGFNPTQTAPGVVTAAGIDFNVVDDDLPF